MGNWDRYRGHHCSGDVDARVMDFDTAKANCIAEDNCRAIQCEQNPLAVPLFADNGFAKPTHCKLRSTGNPQPDPKTDCYVMRWKKFQGQSCQVIEMGGGGGGGK